MTFHFIDTSALLKLFIVEQGSDAMLQFAEAEEDNSLVVSALALIEAQSAISRLQAAHRIAPQDVVRVLNELSIRVRRMIEQPIDSKVLKAAGFLIERYNLRTLDAVQLGSAVTSRERLAGVDMRLIASDQKLLHAARQEGFGVWNPII